jgi:biotin carboxyl carrier protein
MKYRVERAGKTHELEVEVRGDTCLVRGPDGAQTTIRWQALPDGSQRAITPWGDIELRAARAPGELWLALPDRTLHARVERVRPAVGRDAATGGLGLVTAPMAGKLLRVDVQPGERVSAGKVLAVIEAMKMENALTAALDGVVSEVAVQAPAALEKGALILKIEPG